MRPVVKWIAVILLIGLTGKVAISLLKPEITDVTPYLKLSKEEVEAELGIPLSLNPKMAKKIYQFSKGTVTVEGNSKGSIGIIYIDKQQEGFHLDDKLYGMYGIKIGMPMFEVEKEMTYHADERFQVLNDFLEGNATATFYCDHTQKDCLVVVANDMTDRVVALTYFRDEKRATERLSK